MKPSNQVEKRNSRARWVEVRPLVSAKPKPGNLAGLFDTLYNTRRTFRWFVVNCESGTVKGKRVVRLFLQLSSKRLVNYVANLLKAYCDVEVVESKPPVRRYSRCADLELARHYALSVAPEDVDWNPVDGIIQAVGDGGALEVIARRDSWANAAISQYISKRTCRGASFLDAFLDIILGILRETLHFGTRSVDHKERYERQRSQEPWEKAEVEAAQKKLHHNLFTCKVRAYGRRSVKTILDALPSGMNRFKVFKTLRDAVAPNIMAKPSRYSFRNILSSLWIIAPLFILATAWWLGLFNPLRLALVDMIVIVLAVASIFPLLILFRRRNPVVLSTKELSLIVGLPTAVGRLPLELGAAPFSRKLVPGGSEGVSRAPESRDPVYVLGEDPETGEGYGVCKSDRMHVATFGFPGTGKTTMLLSLVLQHIERGEGFMVIDPHGDLAKRVLSHVPREDRGRLVYIDPMTAFKHGSVVQVNFLEYKSELDKGLVARVFMDSLRKIYGRFWGPRLDMILMNAIYLLIDGTKGGYPKLSDLYHTVADPDYREMLLANEKDAKVRSFWEKEYKRMPKEASSSVMTKIYRICQEKVVVPMFECERSSIDFRQLMDQGKWVVVNLSEGEITSDLTNFLGSLILARVYLAGMSREDTPKNQRVPYYVYMDEAHRFVTASIKDILQSLRKYRVYMTLASQYLEQYRKDVRYSIPSLCDTLICFSVGKETARVLEEFYTPTLNYEQLMKLPRYWFAASSVIGGRRECQVMRCIDYPEGQTDIEEAIKHSLKLYGRPVDTESLIGPLAQARGGLPTPELYPTEWLILLRLWRTQQSLSGEGSKRDLVEYDDLIKRLEGEYGFVEPDTAMALRLLSRRVYVKESESERRWTGVKLPEARWVKKPVPCVKCGRATHRPYWLRGSRNAMCRRCAEHAVAVKEWSASSFIGLTDEDAGELYHRSKTLRYYSLHPLARKRFFDDVPRGRRGGGTRHTSILGVLADDYRKSGCFCIVDLGERPERKLPDILVYPLDRRAGERRVNPRLWDVPHRFAVEIETDPIGHPDRVVGNWKKCKAWGMPVLFATDDFNGARRIVEILRKQRAKVVVNISSEYAPGNASVLYIHPETRTQVVVADPYAPAPPAVAEIEEERRTEAEALKKPVEPEAPTVAEEVAERADRRSQVRLYADRGFSFRVKKVKGRRYLCAFKWIEGKAVEKGLGRLDEEAKRIIETLGLRVKGLEGD